MFPLIIWNICLIIFTNYSYFYIKLYWAYVILASQPDDKFALIWILEHIYILLFSHLNVI